VPGKGLQPATCFAPQSIRKKLATSLKDGVRHAFGFVANREDAVRARAGTRDDARKN
jgi:hypothetical protein